MAKQQLEIARRQTAALIGCDPKELVFLSGGTEADNLAILGTVRANPAARKHVITTAIEHPAVLNPCRATRARGRGGDAMFASVRMASSIPDDIRRALRPGNGADLRDARQ